MTTTTTSARTDAREAILDILGDFREALLFGPGDATWIPDYADRILALIHPAPAPPTCHHVRAANADNGYIICEDCGDWLGVWRCLK